MIDRFGTESLQEATELSSGKKKRRRRARPKKKPKKDARVEKFIKAARKSQTCRAALSRVDVEADKLDSTGFVRGHGASAIHPGAKIRLYALRMQAQKGDCPEGKAESELSSVRALQELKHSAWQSLKGTLQEK